MGAEVGAELETSGSPAVDYSLVVDYVDGLLTGRPKEVVRDLVWRYKAWNDAYREVILAGSVDPLPLTAPAPEAVAGVPPAPPHRRSRRFYAIGAAVATAATVLVAVAIWKAIQPAPIPAPGRTPEPPEYALQLSDRGTTIGLTKNGTLGGLDAATDGVRIESRDALRDRRYTRPASLAGLVDEQRGAPVRGSSGPPRKGLPFALVHPVGTTVATDRPTFRWEPLDGAVHYEVTVVTPRGERIRSGRVPGTSWQPPADRPLERGATFEWQVTAVTEDDRVASPVQPAPEARFRVIGADVLRQLDAAREQSHGSHLALATIYVGAGMLDEAETELRALADLNREPPANAAVADLLRSVERLRRPPP